MLFCLSKLYRLLIISKPHNLCLPWRIPGTKYQALCATDHRACGIASNYIFSILRVHTPCKAFLFASQFFVNYIKHPKPVVVPILYLQVTISMKKSLERYLNRDKLIRRHLAGNETFYKRPLRFEKTTPI